MAAHGWEEFIVAGGNGSSRGPRIVFLTAAIAAGGVAGCPTKDYGGLTSVASSDVPGRILRIEDTDTTPAAERKEIVASKPCVVPGCNGTMHFHKALERASAPHTLEWPWFASWRCAHDPTHVELLSPAEQREIRGKALGVERSRR